MARYRYQAFGGSLIFRIIDKLICNNLQHGYIEVDKLGKNVKLTNTGRMYGSTICYRIL